MEWAQRQWLAIIYNGQCSAVEALKVAEKKPFSVLPKWTTSEQHGLCRSDDFRDSVHSVSCVVVFVYVVVRYRGVHVHNHYCFVSENRDWTGETDVSVIASITRRTEKSNEAAGFPVRLGNLRICAEIIGLQGHIVTSFGGNRSCLWALSTICRGNSAETRWVE